jgi:Kef-type K+ transport system membrane component KefB
LVGLEIDVAVIKRNAKTSLTISTGGMILPFGLGAAVAIPVYNNFIDPEAASFGHFLRESHLFTVEPRLIYG